MPKHILVLISVLSLFVSASIRADGLQPFHVQYRLYVSKIPTTIKADLWLRKLEKEDLYQMELEVDSLLIDNRELSTFTWSDCQPRTQHYTHSFRGFGRRRNYQMDFSWNPPSVLTEGRRKTHRTLIEEDTLDELTMLLKARCVLAEGDKQLKVTSVYGTRLREHHMQVIGREIVDTPLGKVECLIVEKKRDQDSERRTLFWVAPEWEYLLVRARHVENRALFGELVMREYDGPVLARAQAE